MNSKNLKTKKKITRKEAIKKAGVTALTAASLLFLETKKASAGSTAAASPGTGRPSR